MISQPPPANCGHQRRRPPLRARGPTAIPTDQPPVTPERQTRLAALARELALQTTWDMGLAGQAIPEQVVAHIEREVLERLLAAG
jgi:hypothetical protein